jgi:hypothetical protein
MKTFEVRMGQGWRERLTKSLRAKGEVIGVGYCEGSTQWEVLLVTSKYRKVDTLRDALRAEFSYDGWLSVKEIKL